MAQPLTDVAIAQAHALKPITEIADRAGIPRDAVVAYGRNKAKVDITRLGNARPEGKLILVTGISPTPAGEGKSTVLIGLTDAMTRLGRKAAAALREPSQGPVMGVKGGAAGGGYSQIVPMEEINLHFTGDFHAISAATNTLAAIVDNHVQQGNVLGIDSRRIVWQRCIDVNDRSLRDVVTGLGGPAHGTPRETGFTITAASEIMAVLCLASDLADLKERLSRLTVAFTFDDEPVTAGELGVTGALAALMKDAINPNLVQTLGGTPAYVHGGPFANIAHGCNSVLATKSALKVADYVVTEAGFGADLGAEKFFDIKCRKAGLAPDACVIVATVRALKMHGGMAKDDLKTENADAVAKGCANLKRHIENVNKFGVPAVVAINRFITDTDAEIQEVMKAAEEMGTRAFLCTHWADGGKGTEALASHVVEVANSGKAAFKPLYPDSMSLRDKVKTIATEIYRAADISCDSAIEKRFKELEEMGFGHLPVCMAKTQYSFSTDPTKRGAPTGHIVPVRELRLSAGAEFVVVITGEIMTMPGLPRVPAADTIRLNDEGQIEGLF